VAQVVEDVVEDEARIILAQPMKQREVFVSILALMCMTKVRSLHQTKCALHGKSLCIILAPTTDKTF
jgi:hypothetical protein